MRRTYETVLTPAIAMEWLVTLDDHEDANGKRLGKTSEKRHVNALAGAMLDGEWRLTHQGMLLGKAGRLLDGRHRALAVVQSGVTIPTMVTEDETVELAVELVGVDTDNANRDHSFTTGYPKATTQMARLLLHYVSRDSRPRSKSVGKVCAVLQPPFDYLQHTNTHRKFRAAAYRSAFVLRVLDAQLSGNYGEMDELRDVYTALCDNDSRTLPPLVFSFYQQLTGGAIRANHDGFPRLWRALDPADRNVGEKLIIRDLPKLSAKIRKEIIRLIPETR